MKRKALINTANCFENTRNWFILRSRYSIVASTSHISKQRSWMNSAVLEIIYFSIALLIMRGAML